jgi:ATP:cob(I)alamin adenosyltransferase
MPISTKLGDGGLTDFGGRRMRKDSPAVGALGALDELQANIALSLLASALPELRQGLSRLVGDCSRAMSVLGGYGDQSSFLEASLSFLEDAIPAMEKKWMPRGFALPGKTEASARLDACRTVCRRAERETLRASQGYPVDPLLLAWLNRLSDYLFLSARGEESGLST